MCFFYTFTCHFLFLYGGGREFSGPSLTLIPTLTLTFVDPLLPAHPHGTLEELT